MSDPSGGGVKVWKAEDWALAKSPTTNKPRIKGNFFHKVPTREWARRQLVGAAGSCGQLSGARSGLASARFGLDLRPPLAARVPPMAVEHLFTQALGLASPWKVVSCNFDPAAKSLELVIDFERGSRFADPETGKDCPVHDTVQRSWEHLRFFEHRTTIHARVPRIKTPSGAVKTVEVPWAKPHSGFTLLMEA